MDDNYVKDHVYEGWRSWTFMCGIVMDLGRVRQGLRVGLSRSEGCWTRYWVGTGKMARAGLVKGELEG